MVTTDSSFTDLPREAYTGRKRVIEELQSLGKPFLVLVNSSEPNGEAAQCVCAELQSQYGIAPIAVNCLELDESGIADILQQVLRMNFRSAEIGFVLPRYIGTLPLHHPVQNSIYQCIRTAAEGGKMRDVQKLCRTLEENENNEPSSGRAWTIWRSAAALGGRACGRTGNRILRHCRRADRHSGVRDDAD